MRIRSKLFVPGSRPELFDKALSSGADAICVDLEDSVRADSKDSARANLRRWLDERAGPACMVMVRVNGIGNEHFKADLLVAAHPAVGMVSIPKVDDVSTLLQAEALLDAAGAAAADVGLLPTIESPRGLRHAHALATSSRRVRGLQLGLGDLTIQVGTAARQPDLTAHARLMVRLAAAEAGVPAFDSACADVQDAAAFRRDAFAGRDLGYEGKSCIHPRQVAWVNEIFAGTEGELAWARRLLSAASDPANAGRGAFMFEGGMVDLPVVRQAEEMLASAAHSGPKGDA